MDLLTGMRIFIHVVEANSFTAASNKLGLSRAAVSKHIVQLESHLGGRLLNRTTRRVSVTEAGQAYFERCKQILEDVADAECVVSGLSKEPRGTLRLNVPMTFGTTQIAPLLQRFNAAHPNVEIELSLNDRLIDVVDEGYDLVIRIAELQDSNLIARRLATSRHVICASPAYLERHGRPATPADLATHACLRYSYTQHSSEWLLHGADGEQRVRISGPLLTNNGGAICTAAENGLGITMLPTFIAGQALRKGKLERVLTDYGCPQLGIYAVYPSNRHLSAKVRSFIDFLVTEFSDPPRWDKALFTAAEAATGPA
jgi:DNA-binding transcriptional LysR family regulator